jgi:hypothetical protein
MPLSAAQDHANLVQLCKWIDTTTSGLELPADEKSMLASGCLDVTLEHQAAIALLFQAGLHGSMFSLLRVLNESVARGMWLNLCASPAEVAKFKQGKIDKDFGQLIADVEAHIGIQSPVLSNLKASAWKAFNGFTHTGFNQVARRHDGGQLVGNYPEEEVKQALRVAGALGLVAAGQLVAMSTNPGLLPSVSAKMAEYSGHGA